MRLKKIVKYHAEYLFLLLLTYTIRLFPLKTGLFSAVYLGRILFYLDKTHRNRALENLRNAFPEIQINKLLNTLKNVYINLTKVYIEFLNLPHFNMKYLEKNVSINGKDNLDKALRKNKGIIAITGHIGNWELLGTILVKNGYHLDAIYHPMRNPLSDRFFNCLREKAGIKLIPIKNAFRPCLQSLRQNHILGLIADQDAGGDGVAVDFFNRPASTAKGPAFFAVRTGSPVLFFTLIRGENDRHTLHISRPLNVKITGKLQKDIYYNTKLWSDELEKWVRLYPEQWFWVHRKWHTKKENI